MIALLSNLFGKFKLWLALAGGVVLAIGVAALRGYSAGKQAQRDAQRRALEKANRRVRERRTESRSRTDDELDRELDRWSRDD